MFVFCVCCSQMRVGLKPPSPDRRKYCTFHKDLERFLWWGTLTGSVQNGSPWTLFLPCLLCQKRKTFCYHVYSMWRRGRGVGCEGSFRRGTHGFQGERRRGWSFPTEYREGSVEKWPPINWPMKGNRKNVTEAFGGDQVNFIVVWLLQTCIRIFF